MVAQCRAWQHQEERGELTGRLGLLWPGELQHWERTLTELQPARMRLLWQTGQVLPSRLWCRVRRVGWDGVGWAVARFLDALFDCLLKLVLPGPVCLSTACQQHLLSWG